MSFREKTVLLRLGLKGRPEWQRCARYASLSTVVDVVEPGRD
jgi:hypothetical protein